MFVPPLSLDAIRQPAILYDADGRIAEANDLAEALAGRSLAGRTIAAVVGIFDVRSPDGTPLMASDLPATRALNGEEAVDVPLSVTAADGRTVHVLARASPLRDGGSVAGALVVWQDVSALAAQGEVLREIEAKYRSLFDSLDDGYCIIEMIFDAAGTPVDCRVLETNRAFENQTGLHDAIGKRMRELVPDHEEHWFEIYGTIARTGESQRFIQAAQPFMGGWYEVYAFPIRGRTSNRVAILFNDITELKRSEEALRLYAENLQRATEDLERFVRVSSHDLQEPLRLIVSFSQLLERRYRGKLDADADDYINFIVEGGTRMRALIYDLLAYSRVSATPQEYSSTDTADVLASVERSLAVQLREAGAVITHDPMPGVLADPLQLEQVFANLVSNAFKFRRLHEPLQVHVGARRTDGFWEFSVRDNGIGIEPEYYGRIFEMFRRLHTHDKFGGTGIGLAIVKRIIERHGGTIQVESTPGEGSTFFFTLPAA